MRKRKNLRRLAIRALAVPIFVGLAAGGAHAAENADSYVQNAERLVENHDLNGAESQLRKAAQLAPQDGFVHMRLAEIYVQQGRMNDAAAELILAKQRGVAEEFRAALLSQVMYTKQEFGDLLRSLPAGNRPPDIESTVRTYRGLAELFIGNNDNAKKMFESAEELTPKSTAPKVGLARTLLAMRDVDAAGRKIDEVLAMAPRDSRALDAKGVVLLARGNFDESLNYFNNSLKESPTNSQAAVDRATLYIAKGDLDSADKDVQLVERRIPGNTMVLYLKALVATRRGNYQLADVTLTKFRDAMNRWPDSFLLAGVVKYHLNQAEQSDYYLKRFIAQGARQAYQLQGALALRQGNPERAVTLLDQAFKLAPDNPDTIAKLKAEIARSADAPPAKRSSN